MKKHNSLLIIFTFCALAFALVFTACTPLEGSLESVKEKAISGTGLSIGDPFTVIFNSNGGSGFMSEETFYSGIENNLPLNTFKFRSRTFKGWSTTSTGQVEYTNGEIVTLSPEAGSILTLWAVWGLVTTVPGANLAAKFSWLDSNVINNTTYTVEVSADTDLDPRILSYSGYSGVGIRIKGMNSSYKNILSLTDQGSLFIVESGVTLILDNITLQGIDDNNTSLVVVNSGAKLEMDNGAIITDNNVTEYSPKGGGAVLVNGGTFIMNSGSITRSSSSSGGGVGIYAGGEFTMKGGRIYYNTAYDGGGVSVENASFIMEAGEISGNYAANSGGGVFIYNGVFRKEAGALLAGFDSWDKNSTWMPEYEEWRETWEEYMESFFSGMTGHAVFAAFSYESGLRMNLSRNQMSYESPLSCAPDGEWPLTLELEDLHNDVEGWCMMASI